MRIVSTVVKPYSNTQGDRFDPLCHCYLAQSHCTVLLRLQPHVCGVSSRHCKYCPMFCAVLSHLFFG